MMLKTVYGPPPADRERIEATEEEADSALVRETTGKAAMAADPAKAGCPAAGLDRKPE